MGTLAITLAGSLGAPIVVLGVLGVILWIITVVFRFRRARWRPKTAQCKCGYSYSGLDLPRCPECGRAVGFNKTFDELGVPEQKVLEHVRRRSEELREKPLPAEARDALRLMGEMERKLRIDALPARAAESLRTLEATGKKPSHEQGPPPTPTV